MQHVAIHPDKNKLAVAHGKTINIYDTNGNSLAEMTDKQDIMVSTFNAQNILFVRHENSHLLTKYDYTNNSAIEAYLNKDILSIACHPTQDQIAVCTENELVLLNTNLDVERIIKTPQISYVYP